MRQVYAFTGGLPANMPAPGASLGACLSATPVGVALSDIGEILPKQPGTLANFARKLLAQNAVRERSFKGEALA